MKIKKTACFFLKLVSTFSFRLKTTFCWGTSSISWPKIILTSSRSGTPSTDRIQVKRNVGKLFLKKLGHFKKIFLLKEAIRICDCHSLRHLNLKCYKESFSVTKILIFWGNLLCCKIFDGAGKKDSFLTEENRSSRF